MIHSKEIEKYSNTFFIIKAFNKYICYESFFGNVVKVRGQTAYGHINRITSIVPFLKDRDNAFYLNFFYVEPDDVHGLVKKQIPSLLKSKPRTPFEYKKGKKKFKNLTYTPFYDIIVRGDRLYYCIEVNDKFFLYDDDFGNPLMADITDDKGNTYIVKSGTQKNTLSIIKSLPENAIVYSLKVTTDGLEKGSDEMRKFKSENAKELNKKTEEEKKTDGTRSKIIKTTIKQKKIEKLMKS